jgi:hypothetical protein
VRRAPENDGRKTPNLIQGERFLPRGFLKDSYGGPPMTDDRTSTYQKIRYPHWQHEFEAALLERDPQKLREHVDAAEAAMFQRAQALVESANGHAEQQAISDAIRTLRTIQREKLGYPEWNKNNS